ncbi:MAG TPA: hypothetical protein DEA55_02720 [Rhodospirillaceae bacterium]|nr:hypothetical protein [Rhodospirillaceae bacterium]
MQTKFQNVVIIAGLTAVAVAVLAALWFWNDRSRTIPEQSASSFSYVMEPYPELPPLPPLKIAGPEGKELNLDDFRGSYVLLNLWATWCAPCIEELPSLQNLKEHYEGKGLEVLAVSVDREKAVEDLSNFLKMHDLGRVGPDHVALYHDFQDDIQKAIAFNGLPVTFLIGPDGRILYQAKKPQEWDSEEIIKFLESVQKAKAY